jgi:hypothetical protein
MTHVTPQLVWSLVMKSLLTSVRWLALSAAFVLPFVSVSAHAADNIDYFVPYSGEGNLVVFDATAGTGGWIGAIDQSPFPAVASPLSFVSSVLFTLDAPSNTFSGNFEFTTTDLASSLFGTVGGSYASADIFNLGGQLSIDYQILGGSGQFAGASGFGLSLIDFDPAGSFNNYSEAGLLSFAAPVPEPSTWLLMGLGLGLLAWTRRTPVFVRRAASEPT